MSLINKMLQDLEARERGESTQTVSREDLRAVHYSRAPKSIRRTLLLGTSVVLALAVAAYYLFEMSWRTPPALTTQVPLVSPAQEAQAPVAENPVTSAAIPAAESSVKLTLRENSAPSRPQVGAATDVPLTLKPTPKAPVHQATTNKAPSKALSTPPQVSKVVAPEPSAGKAIFEKQDRPLTPLDQAEERYREAAQFASQGRAEDARASINAALALAPLHHPARELAAMLAMRSGRLQEAQELLSQGVKVAPTRLSFAQLLARVHLEQNSEAQAITVLENARAAGAGNADYFSLLAALYQRNGRHPDAVTAYRESIAVRDQDARNWLGLGISLEAMRDGGSAAGAYNRALALGGLDAKLAQYAQQRLAALKK